MKATWLGAFLIKVFNNGLAIKLRGQQQQVVRLNKQVL